MKKILGLVVCMALGMSAFAQTIDGLIAVAKKDELPSGLFGKAAGYLPGDSVSITNPDTGITLQILNLGTLDSNGKIAILLSRESAEKLGISDSDRIQVKLNQRSGYFDEAVSGTAVMSKNEKETEAVVEEKIVMEEEPKELPVPQDAISPEEELVVLDDSLSEPVVMEKIEDDVAPAENLAELDKNGEEELFVDENKDFLTSKTEVEQASPAEVAETEIINDFVEPVEEIAVVKEEEEDELVAVIEESEEEELAEVVEETVEVIEEPVVAEVVPESEPEEEIAELVEEEEGEEIIAVVEESVQEPEEEMVELVAEESVIEETAAAEEPAYEAIVLSEPVKQEPVAIVPVPVEEESVALAEPEIPAETEIKIPEPLVSEKKGFDISPYLVASEDDLQKNAYYIQIASYGSLENLEKIVKTYSQYPIKFVPTGKGSYRVLVGALNIDEYGATLKKFKAYGFKDAFIKHK